MSENISIRFHQTLNDFLPGNLRNVEFSHELKEVRSVKDLAESLGVPHTEIDLIIVNGKSVDYSYLLRIQDRLDLYPLLPPALLASLSISPLHHCLPEPLVTSRFILDVHLGKLAAYLRMMGFDTLYRNDYDDLTLADISANEDRILLTCDRRLLMRKQVSRAYFVRSRQPQQQLAEVLARYDLTHALKPFTRCMHCNGKTRKVEKAEIESVLLAKTKKYYNEFFQCAACKKIYWKGSHYQKMKSIVEQFNNAQTSPL